MHAAHSLAESYRELSCLVINFVNYFFFPLVRFSCGLLRRLLVTEESHPGSLRRDSWCRLSSGTTALCRKNFNNANLNRAHRGLMHTDILSCHVEWAFCCTVGTGGRAGGCSKCLLQVCSTELHESNNLYIQVVIELLLNRNVSVWWLISSS